MDRPDSEVCAVDQTLTPNSTSGDSAGCRTIGRDRKNILLAYWKARTTLAYKSAADGCAKGFGVVLCLIGVLVLWLLLTVPVPESSEWDILTDCKGEMGLAWAAPELASARRLTSEPISLARSQAWC